jgi:hypothetical protein
VPRHASYVPYADGLGVLAFAALFLVLRSRRINLGEICGEMALTVTGHLRCPPDRAAEERLTAVFAEFDRELAVILADRPRAALPDR